MGTILTAIYYMVLFGILYGIKQIFLKAENRKWVQRIAAVSGLAIIFLFL